MKKFTLFFLLILIYSISINAQCLNAPNGQYPSGVGFILNTCDSSTPNEIRADCWAGEYSLVSVDVGQTYEFRSSISTDYITISNNDGTLAKAFGTTPILWTSDVTGDIRFYTHTDAACGANTTQRSRSVVCGAGLLTNEEFNIQDFKFYPNPAENKISVHAKDLINQVLVYNLIGQEVIRVTPFSLSDEIDISGLTNGTYIMNVNINNSSGIFKLIKK